MIAELSQAVILAGGLGTRLRPIVSDRPKALAIVAGEPFLRHQLRWLRDNSVYSAILCVGYKGDQIIEELGDGSSFGMRLAYSQEHTPLGTGGALVQAGPLLPSEFLVINGDTYTDLSLEPLWKAHWDHEALVTLAVTNTQDSTAVGGIELAGDGRIIAFREKQPGATLVSMGIYVASKELLNHIPTHRPCSLEKDVFPRIGHLYGHISQVPFIDIGTPSGYHAAQTYLAAKNRAEKSESH
ncbi:MAG: NTP transferase domain-containing protein [Firmicutes bacterium]|nr:NTP transferase domain-containing protein [Bacillota bacterium]